MSGLERALRPSANVVGPAIGPPTRPASEPGGPTVEQEHAGGRDVAPRGPGMQGPWAVPVWLHQLLRYTVTGGIAMAVSFAVYAAGWRMLSRLGVRGDYLLADLAAWFAGMVVNYRLSAGWVFERRSSMSPATEFTAFAAIGLIGLGWSQLALWGLVGGLGVQRDLAKVVAAAIVFVWNFTMRKTVLFRSRDTDDDQKPVEPARSKT